MKYTMNQRLWIQKSANLMKFKPEVVVRELKVGEEVMVVVPSIINGWLKVQAVSDDAIGFFPEPYLSVTKVTDENGDGIPDKPAPGSEKRRVNFEWARNMLNAVAGWPWKTQVLPAFGLFVLVGLMIWLTPWSQLFVAAGQYSALGPNIWVGAGNLLMNVTVSLTTTVVLLTFFAARVRGNLVAHVATYATYGLQFLGYFWAIAANVNENASVVMVIAWYILVVVSPLGPTYLERARRIHGVFATIAWSVNCLYFGALLAFGTVLFVAGEVPMFTVVYLTAFVLVSAVGLLARSIRK